MEASADKKVWVRLAVDGYPRAFAYLVRLDRTREQIARERSLEEVRIVSPATGQAYRVPLEKPIALELQVDAPEDSFRNEADSVQVQIVADESERELCPEERRRFYSDRQTEIGAERDCAGRPVDDRGEGERFSHSAGRRWVEEHAGADHGGDFAGESELAGRSDFAEGVRGDIARRLAADAGRDYGADRADTAREGDCCLRHRGEAIKRD